MIDRCIEATDLEVMFKSQSWKWFKAFCDEQAQLQVGSILSSDPQQAAWSIARSQGYYEAMSSISTGMETPAGRVSFETYLLDKLQDQMEAESAHTARHTVV